MINGCLLGNNNTERYKEPQRALLCPSYQISRPKRKDLDKRDHPLSTSVCLKPHPRGCDHRYRFTDNTLLHTSMVLWEIVSNTELLLRYVSQTIMSKFVGNYLKINSLEMRWEKLSTVTIHTAIKHSRPLPYWLSHPTAVPPCGMGTEAGQGSTGEHSQARLGACAKGLPLCTGLEGECSQGAHTSFMALNCFLSDVTR